MATAAAAVGHFQPRAKILSRSKGDSVAGKAAYNARTRIENERTGKVYDFSHLKNPVLSRHFFSAANAPEWARTPEGYFNGIEMREGRSDSQLAMDWVIDIPHQMRQTPEHAKHAFTDFIRENFQRKGYGAELVFHPPHDHGDERNFHAHLIVGIRRFEKDGTWAAVKDGVPNDKQLAELRWRMADEFNRQLEKHRYEIRVDHRSNEERGIDREPTIHLGKHAAALERHGTRTEPGNLNREIEARNEARAERNFRLTQVIARELYSLGTESTAERMGREDREQRDRDLKDAELELGRKTRTSNADREMLTAVRRLMRTMGIELAGQLGVDPAQARTAHNATRAWSDQEERKRHETFARAAHEQNVQPIQEEAQINERRRIQERLAEHRAGLEAQLEKERQHETPRKPEPQHTAKRRVQPQPQQRRQGADRGNSWMKEKHGYAAMTDALQQAAERSYEQWKSKDPDRKKTMTLSEYVAFVQKQEQKRGTGRTQTQEPAKERERVLQREQRPRRRRPDEEQPR